MENHAEPQLNIDNHLVCLFVHCWLALTFWAIIKPHYFSIDSFHLKFMSLPRGEFFVFHKYCSSRKWIFRWWNSLANILKLTRFTYNVFSKRICSAKSNRWIHFGGTNTHRVKSAAEIISTLSGNSKTKSNENNTRLREKSNTHTNTHRVVHEMMHIKLSNS